MRTIISFCLCLFGATLSSQAQDAAQFSVNVSTDSVLLGNYFTVTFSLANGEGEDLVFPEFVDFQVVGGPSYSSRINIVNGRMNQTLSYTFYLEPRDVGEYWVGPASVAVNGTYLETEPVLVQVAPNPEGIIQQPQRQAPSIQPFEDEFFQGFFNDDFFDNDFFDRSPNFRLDIGPGFRLQPSLPDSTQQRPKKRKTTRI